MAEVTSSSSGSLQQTELGNEQNTFSFSLLRSLPRGCQRREEHCIALKVGTAGGVASREKVQHANCNFLHAKSMNIENH